MFDFTILIKFVPKWYNFFMHFIITGKRSIDGQTKYGKIIAGVAKTSKDIGRLIKALYLKIESGGDLQCIVKAN